jgi:hypothetical protein
MIVAVARAGVAPSESSGSEDAGELRQQARSRPLAVFSALVARHEVLHQLVIHARPIRSQHPRLLVTPHPGGIPAGQRPSGDPSDAMPGSLQPDDEPGKVAGRQTSPAPVPTGHPSLRHWCGSNLEFDGDMVRGRESACAKAADDGVTDAVEMAPDEHALTGLHGWSLAHPRGSENDAR